VIEDDETGTLDYDEIEQAEASESTEESEKAFSGEEDEASDLPSLEDDVPEELLPIKKKMEQGMHKKFRELADQRKALEEKMASLEQKASAFDRAVLDPDYRNQLFAAAGNGSQKQQAAAEQALQSFYGADLSEYDDSAQKVMKEAAMMAVQEKLFPMMEQVLKNLNSRIDSFESERAMEDWKRVAGDAPDSHKKLEAVSDFLRQNPNFLANKPRETRLRKALLVISDEPTNGKPPQAKKRPAKPAVNGNLLDDGASTANLKPKQFGKSLADLLEAQLKKRGMSLPSG